MYIYDLLYVLRCCTPCCSYSCLYGLEDKRGDYAYKSRGSFVKKRGCQCHFIVKVLNQSPHIAILTYNTHDHEDEYGWTCHGQHNKSSDVRALYCPRFSRNFVNYMESCFYMGVPIDVVCQMHIERHVGIDVKQRSRDYFLIRKDVANIYARTRKGSYHLHKKYETSINLWFQR